MKREKLSIFVSLSTELMLVRKSFLKTSFLCVEFCTANYQTARQTNKVDKTRPAIKRSGAVKEGWPLHRSP